VHRHKAIDVTSFKMWTGHEHGSLNAAPNPLVLGQSYTEFSQHSRKQVAIQIRAFLRELCLANHSFVSIQLMRFVD
jgi:hypothetical protein